MTILFSGEQKDETVNFIDGFVLQLETLLIY